MEKYKLGVFGDSYADCKGPLQDTEGWQLNLCGLRNWSMQTNTRNTAESGASNWWAMWNLLNDLDSIQYENIVLSVTTPWRLPITSIKGCHLSYTYKVGYMDQRSDQERQWFSNEQDKSMPNGMGKTQSTKPSELYRVWDELFDPDADNMLNQFISQSVLDKVFQLAEHHNIVVLMPFGVKDYDISKNNLTIIHSMWHPSRKEMQAGDLDVDWIEWHGSPYNDQRVNHLNDNNNKLLAGLIDNALKNNKPQLIDFRLQGGLDYSKETLSKYGKIHYHSENI